MKQFITRGLAILWVIVLSQGCKTILEEPSGEGVDPTLVTTEIELAIDFEPISEPVLASYATALAEDYDVRYLIELHAADDEGKTIVRRVMTEETIAAGEKTFSVTCDLHAGRYEVYAWVDFVPKGTLEDHHYLTSDLREVKLANPNTGGTDTEDAFAGMAEIDLTPYRDKRFARVKTPLQMERPFGKFKIRTTDLQKFVQNRRPGTYAEVIPVKTKLVYTCYFPCSYSLKNRHAVVDDFRMGVNHTVDVREYDENTAVLTSDHVFICSDETVVTADIETYDAAGELIYTVRNIRVPIERGKLTVVSGEFLTTDYGGSGGGIDDRFDDEIVIEIPN